MLIFLLRRLKKDLFHFYFNGYFRLDLHGIHERAEWFYMKIRLVQSYFYKVVTFKPFNRDFNFTCDIANGQLSYDDEIVRSA